MDNPETLATLGTQDTGQRQSRNTGNIGNTRHMTKTIQKHWQHWEHKTQDDEKQNTTQIQIVYCQSRRPQRSCIISTNLDTMIRLIYMISILIIYTES